jgi:hypothetical protein
MTARPSYFDLVRDELVAAAVRERGAGSGAPGVDGDGRDELAARRRPRARWLVAAVALIALVVGIGLVAADTQRVEASGIDVVRTATGVRVRFLDVEHTPAGLQRELDAAGVAIRVIAVPTGGSLVGDVIDIEAPVDLPNDGIRVGLHDVEIDTGWTGVLNVRVGVEALPGEAYVRNVELLADGERLHCVVSAGDPAEAAAAAIAAVDPELEVHWLVRTPALEGDLPLDAILAAEPDVVVNWAIEIASGVANVQLVRPDDLMFAPDPDC